MENKRTFFNDLRYDYCTMCDVYKKPGVNGIWAKCCTCKVWLCGRCKFIERDDHHLFVMGRRLSPGYLYSYDTFQCMMCYE